jgi:hypothetical protein
MMNSDKKTKDTYKLGDRFLKTANFQSHIRKFADKKTAYNEVRLYLIINILIIINYNISKILITKF